MRTAFYASLLWAAMLAAATAAGQAPDPTDKDYAEGSEPIRVGTNSYTAQPTATQHDFNIPRLPLGKAVTELSKQAGILLGYLPTSPAEESALVDPLQGHMTAMDACLWLIARAGVEDTLTCRWVEFDEYISFEPRPSLQTDSEVARLRSGPHCYCADTGEYRELQTPCQCPTPTEPSPGISPPPTETVLVERSPLMDGITLTGPTTRVFDRRRIEEIGVATIADLLRYDGRIAFMRSEGARADAAQFAELRGVGAEYVLVLINGRRAANAAKNPDASAFDLNSVPLSAVERIEIQTGAVSVAQGSDAVAGTVNIVLKKNIDEPRAELRFGSADGGARQRRATVSAGLGNVEDRGSAAFVFDVLDNSRLMGSSRDRWRNQDYTRFGSVDQRLSFGSPANIRSLDGKNLPGIDSSFAAIQSDGSIVAGERNLSSLLAFQAVVPDYTRGSLSGYGEWRFGDETRLSGETLLSHHSGLFPMYPPIAAGMVSGENPYNPLGIPVLYEVMLTGMGNTEQHATSDIKRAVVSLDGSWSNHWTYALSAMSSDEQAQLWIENEASPIGLMMASQATSRDAAINIFAASPGSSPLPAGVMATLQKRDFSSGISQLTGEFTRSLSLPTLVGNLKFGIEHRNEFSQFSSLAGRTERMVDAGFADALLSVGTLSLQASARHDRLSDIGDVTRSQLRATWQPIPDLRINLSGGTSVRPPSLYDLYLPKLAFPTQVVDPLRGEAVPVTVVTGGNANLRPTSARSLNITVELGDTERWYAALTGWQLKMKDRISSFTATALVNFEDAIPSRITRGAPSADDLQIGRPGPISVLDISRANFGSLQTKGIDLTAHSQLSFTHGVLTPRIDVTYTDDFSAFDFRTGAIKDRVALASDLGTIPRWRGVASLTYRLPSVDATLVGRHHSGYRDTNLGFPTKRRIPSRVLYDAVISVQLSQNFTIGFGVMDLLNKEPSFSEVGPGGMDLTQEDLKGRMAHLSFGGEF